jgi:hypothetical protein
VIFCKAKNHPERSEGSGSEECHPERSEGSKPEECHPERSEGSGI